MSSEGRCPATTCTPTLLASLALGLVAFPAEAQVSGPARGVVQTDMDAGELSNLTIQLTRHWRGACKRRTAE